MQKELSIDQYRDAYESQSRTQEMSYDRESGYEDRTGWKKERVLVETIKLTLKPPGVAFK